MNVMEQKLSENRAALSATGQNAPSAIPHRVAHCVFSLGCGGAERQLVATLAGLKAHGWEDIHVLPAELEAAGASHYAAQVEQYACIHAPYTHGDIEYLPASLRSRLKRYPPFIQRKIARVLVPLLQISPHTVHIWSDHVYALLAAKIANIPHVILSWRNLSPACWHHSNVLGWRDLPRTFLRKLLYKHALSTSNVTLICVSKAGAESYGRWLGIAPETIEVVYNGIDAERWKRCSKDEINAEKQRLGIPQDAQVVCGLGRFDATKRPELWIQVAEAICKNTNTYFVLYGNGIAHQRLAERVSSPQIILPGITTRSDLALSMSDIFFHTAKVEGLPNVMLEAQLLGVPIVATNAGGSEEAVMPGTTALLINESENIAQHLETTLRFALGNSGWRQTATEHGPTFVQQKFGIQRMVQQTIALYTTTRVTL